MVISMNRKQQILCRKQSRTHLILKKDLCVIVEISKDLPEAQRISETIRQIIEGQQRGKGNPSMHRIINGDSANGMVSFYGASVTKEQSEKLQNVIKDLEQQGLHKAIIHDCFCGESKTVYKIKKR